MENFFGNAGTLFSIRRVKLLVFSLRYLTLKNKEKYYFLKLKIKFIDWDLKIKIIQHLFNILLNFFSFYSILIVECVLL